VLFKKRTFSGGIHPDDHNDTAHMKTTPFPAPEKVVIPMSMHIGAPARILVKKNDSVKAGQQIGESSGKISAPVHASVSGTVSTVGLFPHPFGGKITGVEIRNDFAGETVRLPRIDKWHETASDILIQRIAEAGIIGKGGASFPTAVKLSPPPGVNIDTLIINAAECEPYLTSDNRLMIEFTQEFLDGVAITKRILDVQKVIIAVEQNKPRAIKAVRREIKRHSKYSFIEIAELETKYPQGAEKQLIKVVAHREVPSGQLPLAVNTVVVNTGTAKAIFDAVVEGKPLYERIVTVAGPHIKSPGNYIIPIGTAIETILAHCGADMTKIKKIVLGGPMMGISQTNLSAPVIKATSGIISLTEIPPARKNHTCINCGSCVSVCPMGLIPSHFAKLAEAEKFDELREHNITDCMDCGSCTYICPAKINIAHAIKLSKDTLKKKQV
jgi:electron transport complex protein RnfC